MLIGSTGEKTGNSGRLSELRSCPPSGLATHFRWGEESGIAKNGVKKTVRERAAKLLSDEPSDFELGLTQEDQHTR